MTVLGWLLDRCQGINNLSNVWDTSNGECVVLMQSELEKMTDKVCLNPGLTSTEATMMLLGNTFLCHQASMLFMPIRSFML
jgi:hypothetical protein